MVNALRKIQIMNNLNIQRQKQREKHKLVVTVRNFLNKEVLKIKFNVFQQERKEEILESRKGRQKSKKVQTIVCSHPLKNR